MSSENGRPKKGIKATLVLAIALPLLAGLVTLVATRWTQADTRLHELLEERAKIQKAIKGTEDNRSKDARMMQALLLRILEAIEE